MDISSSSFGAVQSPYFAGSTSPRQASTSSCGYYVPDSFQRTQNQDDQQQQQPENLVDGPGMVHQLGHHLHI